MTAANEAPGRVVGRSIDELLLSEARNTVREHVQSCFAHPKVVQRWESRVVADDGDALWVRITSWPAWPRSA